MEEWEGPGISREEFGVANKENGKKDDAYDLWSEFSLLKADITFKQLFEISPIIRKTKGKDASGKKETEGKD